MERFGRFELGACVGRGGYAEVFRATAHGIEGFAKPIALKLLLQHLCGDVDGLTRFITEAKLVAHLTHPNIVQTHELGQVDGRYYIAMEYVDGVDLATLLMAMRETQTPIPHAATVSILRDVLLGLAYAHDKTTDAGQALKLVHRDLSPGNILLSTGGQAKIADFGIAKAATVLTKTRTGMLAGKIPYMAPEQASGRPLDRRSDLFTVGLLAYELLRGQPRYTATSEAELLQQARTAELPADLGRLPIRWRKLLAVALAVDPAQRYATAAAFLDALDACREQPSAPAVAGLVQALRRGEQPTLSGQKTRPWLWPLTATCVLTALACGVWLVTRRETPLELQPAVVAAPPSGTVSGGPTQPLQAPPNPVAVATGSLSLNSRPWAHVFIDGERKGDTPLKLRLPAGTHQVRVLCPTAAKTEEFTVQIAPGENVVRKFTF